MKFRHSVFFLICSLVVTASAGAEELQKVTTPVAAPDLSSELYLLPQTQSRQELLPIKTNVGSLTIGAFNSGKKSDAPLENAGVSLSGATATDRYNLNGTIDLSKGNAAVSFAIQSKDRPATLGLLYLYDQADKADTRNRTPLMILPHIGSSLLLPAESGGEIKTYGLYADYALSKDVGIHWAMGYAAVNDERASFDKKAWEYNVGVAYNFFNNFMYEAHFGYLTTDDSTTRAMEQAAPVEEVYMLTNNISMKF
ncbi:MAG: hypothetical protein P8130_12960 [Deltaproteobacteria bacterium]